MGARARRPYSSTVPCTAVATTRPPCRPRWPHEPPCSRLRWGYRGCLGRFEGGGEQVAGRQAAVGPPFLGDGQDLLLGGQVFQLIDGLDGLMERQVARQDDVLAAERD